MSNPTAFCAHCGTRLPEAARFCSSCGSVVPISEASAGHPALQEPHLEPDRQLFILGSSEGREVEVIMPIMGESTAEGTITKWIKRVGEHVKRDEPLFEITTDKVDAEIPSPVEGTLLQICVREGQTVPVKTVVATIGDASLIGALPPRPSPPPSPLGTKASRLPDGGN